MNKIILLDDNTVSKIAAGEVIERPASVVKELVENSIDAGAASIVIEVKDGGKNLIKVSDNGSGMSSEDAKLSIERHSTSKIKSADDLFSINTLGFRGEALASIASVSKFEMLTNSGENGTKIAIEGGKNIKISSTGHPRGTTITVRELFFNTPARQKFMKSNNTELTNIIDLVSKFILSRPDISFKLINDKNETLSSIGNGKLIDAVASIYGLDMAKAMLEIKGSGKIKIKGYTTQPVITKSDRYGETIFVNGRFIRNMLISKAIEEPYRSLIPNGKYPVTVLFIEIDPSDIDVNVHPTKREIKFARADEAMKSVSEAVRTALSDLRVENGNPEYTSSWNVTENASNPDMLIIEDAGPQSLNGNDIGSAYQGAAPGVFQIDLTYIVASEGDSFVVLDQHAAHERILYEKIKNKKVTGTQNLLVPITIEMDAKSFNILIDNTDLIKELGFDVEKFGKNSILVRGVPAVLSDKNIKGIIEDMIAELSNSTRVKDNNERIDALHKVMACKAAVKAGDKLSVGEMMSLIRDLKNTTNPTTCPHGRPVIKKFHRIDMEKMFKRI